MGTSAPDSELLEPGYLAGTPIFDERRVVNLLPQPRFVDLEDRLTTNTARHRARRRVAAAAGLQADDRRRRRRRSSPADDAGCFYGRATLAQLARLHDGALPIGTIRDHPDLADPRRDARRLARQGPDDGDALRARSTGSRRGRSTRSSSTASTRSRTAIIPRCTPTRARSPPTRSARSTRSAASATWSSCPTRTVSAT